MKKIKIIRESLKALLLDELKLRKKIHRDEIEDIAYDHGYCRESATRALRSGAPVKKLNQSNKQIKEQGEKIHWFRWDGGTRVMFNKK